MITWRITWWSEIAAIRYRNDELNASTLIRPKNVFIITTSQQQPSSFLKKRIN